MKSISTTKELILCLERAITNNRKEEIFSLVEGQEKDLLISLVNQLIRDESFQSKFTENKQFADGFLYFISTLFMFLQSMQTPVKQQPIRWFDKQFYSKLNEIIDSYQAKWYETISV